MSSFAAELRRRRHDDGAPWSVARDGSDLQRILTNTGYAPVHRVRVSLRPDDGRGPVRRYFAMAAVGALLRSSTYLNLDDVVVVRGVDTMAAGDVVSVAGLVGLTGLPWRAVVIEWVKEDEAEHQVAIGLTALGRRRHRSIDVGGDGGELVRYGNAIRSFFDGLDSRVRFVVLVVAGFVLAAAVDHFIFRHGIGAALRLAGTVMAFSIIGRAFQVGTWPWRSPGDDKDSR